MSLGSFPISRVASRLLVGFLIRPVPALVLCLGLTVCAGAQAGPVCSFSLSPGSGTAPLLVTATGGCADATSSVTSETLDWGDGNQTAIAPSSFSGFSIQHTYVASGTFTVTLTAMDAAGAQTTVSRQVIVSPNAPPTCTLTVNPTSGTAPLNVTASGSCTDPENDITSTTIAWGEGTSTPGSNGTHTYKNAGNFTITLTATDSVGNTGSASRTVSVQAQNQPPSCTLQITPGQGNAPLTVTATGTCTDPENDITSTTLNWGDGTTTNGTSGTHTFTTPGDFTVVLTATDSGGLTGSASQQVKVTQAQNVPPTCALIVSPKSGSAPLTVTASGTCSDPENDIVSIVLNWGDGTTLNGASGSHTYSLVGSFTVTLTATDIAGGMGTATQTVMVGGGQNAPPQCSMSASPTSGQVPVTVTVVPNCSDPENDISNIVVDFGDGFYGTVSAGSSLSHPFTWAGSFQVTVTATDVAGNVSKPVSQAVATTDSPTMFVGISNGQIRQFDESGKTLKTLDTNQGGTITGMAFDQLDSLYVTDFTANTVTKFNGNGNVMGNFGSGYNCQPESITFDNAGNVYVGETGCSHALLKFDAYGNLAAAYSVTTEVEGSDWIDLAADQCTIYYTSQGTTVFRFNACTGQQQAPFATGLNTGLGIKILPDSSILAADKQDIVHFDSGGRVIGKYTAPGESCWVSLALDPDNKSFWAVDYCSSDVVRFDISSANQLAKFNSATPTNTVYGIAMRSPVAHLPPAGPLIASPQSMTVATGQTASFALIFVPSGSAVDQSFTFSCANLPVGASCQFSPQTATVAASGTTVQVTITTTRSSGAKLRTLSPRFFAWGVLLSGVLFLGDIRRGLRRSTAWRWMGLMLIVIVVASLFACGGSSKSASGNSANSNNNAIPSASSTTPASTYPVIVRGTSNSFQSSTVVNLTVQ
jgi:PKD repeat protein